MHSQIMVDKAMTLRRERVGATIGRLDNNAMVAVERCVALWFGLAR